MSEFDEIFRKASIFTPDQFTLGISDYSLSTLTSFTSLLSYFHFVHSILVWSTLHILTSWFILILIWSTLTGSKKFGRSKIACGQLGGLIIGTGTIGRMNSWAQRQLGTGDSAQPLGIRITGHGPLGA